MDFREDMNDKELVKAPTTINMAEQIAEANRDLSTHTTLKLNKKNKSFDANLSQTVKSKADNRWHLQQHQPLLNREYKGYL